MHLILVGMVLEHILWYGSTHIIYTSQKGLSGSPAILLKYPYHTRQVRLRMLNAYTRCYSCITATSISVEHAAFANWLLPLYIIQHQSSLSFKWIFDILSLQYVHTTYWQSYHQHLRTGNYNWINWICWRQNTRIITPFQYFIVDHWIE